MESFEIKVKAEIYVIVHDNIDHCSYTVFNHKTCHIIKKDNNGTWNEVEHRFGAAFLPLAEIGAAIDGHCEQVA
jgi:hypothetical protein